MTQTPNSRFKMIASGYLVLIKNQQILLAKRFQTGYMDGYYGLPAGHIEDGETLTAGTVREITEEIGLVIKPGDLKLVHIMHRRSNDIRMDFFFVANHWSDEPSNREPEKCSELTWFPLSELPENTIPYIKAALDHHRAGLIYSEFGWE